MMARIPDHWRMPLGLLAGLWLAAALLFAGDIADMAMLWWDSSTYNHILFIPPLIIWLVAQRAALIAPLRPHPWWPGAALVFGAGLVWMFGEASGTALIRQLGAVLMFQAAVAVALGPMLVRALAFPIGYALLLVPFGDELLPLFQDITADLSMVILALSGTPALRDGIFITTPAGVFEVAEECAGVMFLVAMLAFSVLAAQLCFTRWQRRLTFVALALCATILANALRAAGTILVAEYFGIEHAAGVDHIIYGWFFFAFIMIMVMLVAHRWFDRAANAPAVDVTGLDRTARGSGTMVPVGLVAAAALVAAPLWSAQIDGRGGAIASMVTLPAVSGWTMGGTPDPVWKARFDNADLFLQRRYTDNRGRTVDVALAAFSHQAEGRELIGHAQGAADPALGWEQVAPVGELNGAAVRQLYFRGNAARVAASWYLVDGALTADPRRAKLLGLQARLMGGDPRAAALILSTESDAQAMRDWLAAAGGARKIADRALKTR